VPTSEEGVVLVAGNGSLLQVAFPSGTVWIDVEELEKLPEGPLELLVSGQLGRAEPLQAETVQTPPGQGEDPNQPAESAGGHVQRPRTIRIPESVKDRRGSGRQSDR
jgi:hypothetical protein